jgi:hypothetical protein
MAASQPLKQQLSVQRCCWIPKSALQLNHNAALGLKIKKRGEIDLIAGIRSGGGTSWMEL